jgi:hypothetical protein
MATKQKSLGLNMKLEIVCLCEVSSSSKSELERQDGLTSSASFMILKKRKHGIY